MKFSNPTISPFFINVAADVAFARDCLQSCARWLFKPIAALPKNEARPKEARALATGLVGEAGMTVFICLVILLSTLNSRINLIQQGEDYEDNP